MFSSRVDENNKRLKELGAQVTNEEWPGIKNEHIDGIDTAVEICESFHKISKEYSVSLLNISALTKTGSLNGEHIMDVLRFLDVNSDEISVVYLPKFILKDTEQSIQNDIINFLHHLRKKLVLVSLAQRQLSLPSLETLSVYHVTETPHCNKVVDLLVMCRKKIKDEHFGPAVVTGIAAGIVQELGNELSGILIVLLVLHQKVLLFNNFQKHGCYSGICSFVSCWKNKLKQFKTKHTGIQNSKYLF